MIWLDSAPLAVRLRIVGWDAKFARPGVMAKVHIEAMILLTGNNHMPDGAIPCVETAAYKKTVVDP